MSILNKSINAGALRQSEKIQSHKSREREYFASSVNRVGSEK